MLSVVPCDSGEIILIISDLSGGENLGACEEAATRGRTGSPEVVAALDMSLNFAI